MLKYFYWGTTMRTFQFQAKSLRAFTDWHAGLGACEERNETTRLSNSPLLVLDATFCILSPFSSDRLTEPFAFYCYLFGSLSCSLPPPVCSRLGFLFVLLLLAPFSTLLLQHQFLCCCPWIFQALRKDPKGNKKTESKQQSVNPFKPFYLLFLALDAPVIRNQRNNNIHYLRPTLLQALDLSIKFIFISHFLIQGIC